MKQLFNPETPETISLEVDWSPVWEVILGISGYTHEQLRHTFDMDKNWSFNKDSMPSSLIENLHEITETNFWHGLIMLQNRLSASTIQEFSNGLTELAIDCFYEILLPYKSRDIEPVRKETAQRYNESQSFEKYSSYFEGHEFLGGYIRSLGQYSYQKICDLSVNTIEGWYNWISKRQEWEKWTQALEFEQKQNRSLDLTKPIEQIEKVTGGVKYHPEPSVWTVKMIPHVSYRPWLLEKRTPDTKIFFYPLKEEYLTEPGIPPTGLVSGHKALGDELRLKLLYQLVKGPLSLQELSVQFNTSKTTLHHQLSLLKAAKFVQVEKGIYSVNYAQINSFSERLTQYLGVKK
ncbi:ArsR/SmtB family transcription factor [Jeotgalibacillus proteolyticus]|uniref:ArsR/SmtB family transcription factor n=1 Tax=Jeotgalibacillus proteolyticus TaxID=2082395 RepID=UPI003CF911CB